GRRFRADREPRSCVSAGRLRAIRRAPGWRAARRWQRRCRRAPARRPTSALSDLLRRSPPHGWSLAHLGRASAGDYAARPGACRKPPGELYIGSGEAGAFSLPLSGDPAQGRTHSGVRQRLVLPRLEVLGPLGYTAPDLARRARLPQTPQQEIQHTVITPDFATRPVISFQHVWKRYPTGTEALRDINLVVPEGDFVFLVGPSGAGKSTMVRLLIREEKPTKGKIFVEGIELGRMKRRQLPFYRRKVGLVFQDFKLLPNLTIYENVAFVLRMLGESNRVIRSRVEDALDTVSLSGKEQTYPANLSGGEQQRVAIARALVHAPRFIIADEPTGNLDPATAWEIMQLFLRINARGATVVMATHNREIVDLLRRRVVAIDAGQTARD